MIFDIQSSFCRSRGIQSGLTVLSVFVYLLFCGAIAEAGWSVDIEKFHVSAHGQLSCQDCHSDITDGRLHPDPSLVNKHLKDFFDPEQCLTCHDSVEEALEENQHGGREINPAQSYENCLVCHDPHQTRLSGDGSDNLDPEKPLNQQCGVCHEPQTELPLFAEDDEACLGCHGLYGPETPDRAEIVTKRCFHCHANTGTESQLLTSKTMALVIPEAYRKTPHADLACTECHYQATNFPHGDQRMADCGECHLPHPESTTHDMHAAVACQACHLPGVEAVREPGSGRVTWQKDRDLNAPLNVHEMVVSDDQANCRRCHVRDNSVGASAMVLPAKGVICMPCHTATLSFGDTITAGSLILLFVGLGMSLLLMLSVSSGRKASAGRLNNYQELKTSAGNKTGPGLWMRVVIKVVSDVFFQKRLYERSPGRWFIHALMFFPMALRFLWGIMALGGSLWRPQWQWVWQAMDKNHGGTALFFDVTGVMILSGVILALGRHFYHRSSGIMGLPRRSCLTLTLLGAIVLTGFILEGMRIAMTGTAGDAAYAFIGFGLSRLFSNPGGLSDVYGYGWYVHAVLTGAFIVFLPFSRLLHVILSPMVLALNAVTRHE